MSKYYNIIIDPNSNKKININSKKGIKILNEYVKLVGGSFLEINAKNEIQKIRSEAQKKIQKIRTEAQKKIQKIQRNLMKNINQIRKKSFKKRSVKQTVKAAVKRVKKQRQNTLRKQKQDMIADYDVAFNRQYLEKQEYIEEKNQESERLFGKPINELLPESRISKVFLNEYIKELEEYSKPALLWQWYKYNRRDPRPEDQDYFNFVPE